MQELDLLGVTDYSSVNLSLYRSAKVFKFSLAQFRELNFHHNEAVVMNRLQTLEIDGDGENFFDIDGFSTVIKQHFNFTNITTLRLCDFGNFTSISDRLHIDVFYKILSAFPNIQHLTMWALFLNAMPDPIKMYSKLHGIGSSLYPPSAINTLLGHYCEHLSHLMVMVILKENNFAQMNFSKLQTLDFINGDPEALSDILRTATNLKRIHVNFVQWPIFDMKCAVMNRIKSCKSLQLLDLCGGDEINPSEEGLYATKKWKRKEMRIVIRMIKINSIKKLIFKIGNIFNWLQSSVDHFMFMIEQTKRATMRL